VITIVSGLPRSGTSLMMQMLRAGGLPILSDETRPADQHNQRGYFEDRRVRSLGKENGWLHEAEGKALKVVSQLLYHLPAGFDYRVLFLRRDLDEVLRSQETMLSGLGQPAGPDRAVMRAHFEQHLAKLDDWLPQQQHLKVLNVEHRQLIADAASSAQRVKEFLGVDLDVKAMAQAVDPALHRQRTQ
jgi:hypothetical protein